MMILNLRFNLYLELAFPLGLIGWCGLGDLICLYISAFDSASRLLTQPQAQQQVKMTNRMTNMSKKTMNMKRRFVFIMVKSILSKTSSMWALLFSSLFSSEDFVLVLMGIGVVVGSSLWGSSGSTWVPTQGINVA